MPSSAINVPVFDLSLSNYMLSVAQAKKAGNGYFYRNRKLRIRKLERQRMSLSWICEEFGKDIQTAELANSYEVGSADSLI